MNPNFEIEWRDLLIKRLLTVQTVLKRDVSAEEKKIAEARKLAAGFDSCEDAHEAYGWDSITEEQYDYVKNLFENPEMENKAEAAFKALSWIILDMRTKIRELKPHDEDVQDAVMRKFEEQQAETEAQP